MFTLNLRRKMFTGIAFIDVVQLIEASFSEANITDAGYFYIAVCCLNLFVNFVDGLMPLNTTSEY